MQLTGAGPGTSARRTGAGSGAASRSSISWMSTSPARPIPDTFIPAMPC